MWSKPRVKASKNVKKIPTFSEDVLQSLVVFLSAYSEYLNFTKRRENLNMYIQEYFVPSLILVTLGEKEVYSYETLQVRLWI